LIGMSDTAENAIVKIQLIRLNVVFRLPGTWEYPVTAVIEGWNIYKNPQGLLVVQYVAIVLLGFSGVFSFHDYIFFYIHRYPSPCYFCAVLTSSHCLFSEFIRFVIL
jgi:hypothetical protein